jgi:hypothetical protein
MSNYYEVVLFSERDLGMAEPIFMALDPSHKCHYLTNQHAQQTKDLKYIKRLDLMNRDVRRIILIDDDPDSFAGFERNSLQIKPFEDIRDKSDSVLIDLIPLLHAMVQEESRDFREVLDNLGTRYAEDAAVEYQLRLAKAKEAEKRRRNYGVGGLLRSYVLKDRVEEDSSVTSRILSPSAIVGGNSTTSDDSTPKTKALETLEDAKGYEHFKSLHHKADVPVVKKKGAMLEWLDKVEREKEELEKVRGERMNQIYQKKMEEKRKQEKKAAESSQMAL